MKRLIRYLNTVPNHIFHEESRYITAKKVKLYLKPYPYVTVRVRDFRDYKTNQFRLKPFEMS